MKTALFLKMGLSISQNMLSFNSIGRFLLSLSFKVSFLGKCRLVDYTGITSIWLRLFTTQRNRGLGEVILPLLFVLGCVCVCVYVCVCLSVCLSGCLLVYKIPAERMHRFGRDFRYMVAHGIFSDPIKIGDLESKVKVTVTQFPFFFLFNSLLTSQL